MYFSMSCSVYFFSLAFNLPSSMYCTLLHTTNTLCFTTDCTLHTAHCTLPTGHCESCGEQIVPFMAPFSSSSPAPTLPVDCPHCGLCLDVALHSTSHTNQCDADATQLVAGNVGVGDGVGGLRTSSGARRGRKQNKTALSFEIENA